MARADATPRKQPRITVVLQFEEPLPTRSPEKQSKGFTLALIEENIVRMNLFYLL